MTVTIPTSDPRGLVIEEFDTTTLLAHAAQQARARNYQDYFICDVDSHHYESEAFAEIVDRIKDPVIRQQALVGTTRGIGLGLFGSMPGNQDQSGRVTRYHTRRLEKWPAERQRDAALTTRWMDAMGIDIAFLFPTPMLTISGHPVVEHQVAYIDAYNSWLTEVVMAREPRLRTMLCLPFADPEACIRTVEEYGDHPSVKGFLVIASHNLPVHSNRYMKLYAMLQERKLPIAFHGSYNWNDHAFATTNRFISVHALGFVFYNMLHMMNWVVNGLPERFPDLKVIWMESGLAWVPFMMQRLDNEYMMRSNECPSLKMRPSMYMKKMYYSVQPMEMPEDLSVLATTFKMIDAETQLLYSSDYPHWDFDLPSVIFDLPFLDDRAKRNILGETARELFNLGPLGKLAQIPQA